MKKLISILLLSLYLVSTTELYQLLKIPDLIEHYCEHKALNPEMTFTAFFKTHYDHPARGGDYRKDQKLPFVMHAAPLTVVFTLEQGFSFEIRNTQFRQLKSHKILSGEETFFNDGFRSSVWEPPRSVFA